MNAPARITQPYRRTPLFPLRLLLAALVAFAVVGLAAAARAETIQIVVIGDSNVAGHGVAPPDSYPAQLEAALRAKGYDAQVSNQGIDGDTVQGTLNRSAFIPQGTRLAIVWVGINDIRAGMSEAAVEAVRQKIAASLRARGIKVLLLGPRHGLASQPQYLIGDTQNHLNAAGYREMVGRTIGQVMALIGAR